MAQQRSSSAAVAWQAVAGDLSPAPSGMLRVEVACRTTAAGPGCRHPIAVAADWSVDTGHDLALERVAAALGGRLSCLGLVDHDLPAARAAARLHARLDRPPLARTAQGRWRVTTGGSACGCGSQTFATAREAARHGRSAPHVAAMFGADPSSVAALLDAVLAAHGGFAACPPPGWHALELVREPWGLDELWDVGVPPEFVATLQGMLLPQGPPLPAAAYLGAAFHCPDHAWLAALLAARPDPDVAVWAAWGYSAADRSDPLLRRRWLEVQVPRSTIDDLVEGRVEVDDAEVLAEATGRSVAAAATLLGAWSRVGARPGVDDVRALDRVGIGDVYRPSGKALAGFGERELMDLPIRPTRTQLAVLLGLAGTRKAAWSLLRNGVVTAEHALAMAHGLSLPPRTPLSTGASR